MTNLTPEQIKEECKHRGGKIYWNILDGFKCKKCGVEVIDKSKEVKEKKRLAKAQHTFYLKNKERLKIIRRIRRQKEMAELRKPKNRKKLENKYLKRWRINTRRSMLNNKFKYESRLMFREAIRKGKIKRLPCIKCGESKSHGHHTDYSKPFKVVWLCRRHHNDEHVRLRRLGKEIK